MAVDRPRRAADRSVCGRQDRRRRQKGEAGETLWFIVDAGATGTTVQAQASTDLTRDVGTLRCDFVCAGPGQVTGNRRAVPAQGIAVSLIAAEAAGIARWCVDNVVAYLKVREQFGRPIGTFQAVAAQGRHAVHQQ